MAGFGPEPDPAAISAHDLLARRQADAAAGTVFAMQPLKWLEDLFLVLRFDADAVVADFDHPFALALGTTDAHTRRRVAPVLQRVAHQVLKQLHQVSFVSRD